ncbi:DUF4199 domain-containing protein [Mucilaginibacter sp. 14171R-50]|uniref:DUF4199 domain-containing protein n=1 Tax=Mucilaginibacter sp. 14171R-50 TaxID=2703789 RepID=UPI00138DAC2A|nr:DUF4199 domain-containing protein [Mucilaginibacter sp. 14171R-50]QHS57526.1 DUF4199 domain-containing protein [Mucilaginibacter sp. 14171R-50]
MKRIILICGLIGGLISVGWFLLSEQLLTLNISMNARMFFGYATMIVGLSVIFAGIKNYRDNYNNGVISFGRGLKIGLLITLVASTIYVIVWMIDYTFFVPDFFDKYKALMLADMKAQGAGAAEIQAKMAETDNYIEMYRNPLVNIMFTYMEIVPVGLVISIIAALILKRRQKPVEAA